MRILLTTTVVPFVEGGAEALARGLRSALIRAGHQADIMTLPFVRWPPEELFQLMSTWERFPYESLWVKADRVIPLKFPAYYGIDARTVWLLHEFREAYALLAASYPGDRALAVQSAVLKADQQHLSRVKNLYTLSKTVARRIKHHIGIDAEPLYHPCPSEEMYFQGDQLPFIFAPSRLEPLKRQSLLIEAMAQSHAPVSAVIAGDGSQAGYLRQLAEQLGVTHKVIFTGAISEQQKLAMYAHCLAVYFAPVDEDYGYVTLEAMLAGKPVITARDSGGPNEFVVDGETGYVAEPTAAEIAARIDALCANFGRARSMGMNGLDHYHRQHISWDHVVDKLLL